MTKLPNMVIWLILLAVGGLVLFAAHLYFHQERMVFYPTRDFAVTPSDVGLPYEDVYIEVATGERIHGWYFRARGDTAATASHATPTVLFCHGNGGNISHRLETAEFIRDLGADLLLFDYRGYGQSDGKPSEANVYADAEACFRWLVESRYVPAESIVVFGRSLGGAVAVNLARRVQCGGLIIESSFTSAAGMGRRMFPWFPIRYLLRYEFNSIRDIGDVSCPVLVTHSRDDEMIPYEMGRRLFEQACEPKLFVPLEGQHNERLYFRDSVYREAVSNILLEKNFESWTEQNDRAGHHD